MTTTKATFEVDSLTVQGPSVIIRPLVPGDADDVYAHVSSKDVARWTFTIPHPYPREEAAAFIRRSKRSLSKGESITLGIVPNDVDKVVGVVSLKGINTTHKAAELGYWIGTDYWSCGYTTEAVQLMLDIAFRTLRLHRVWAIVFESNTASQQVLRKCGFVHEGTLREAILVNRKRESLLNYGLLRDEYQRVNLRR